MIGFVPRVAIAEAGTAPSPPIKAETAQHVVGFVPRMTLRADGSARQLASIRKSGEDDPSRGRLASSRG